MRGTAASTEYETDRKMSVLIQLSFFWLEGVQARSYQLGKFKSLCAVKGETLK